MFKKFNSRALDEEEIIDDFTLSGPAIEDTFDSIEKVNIWLGGNQVLRRSFQKILKSPAFQNLANPIKVYDLGCGIGDGLVALAKWTRKQKIATEYQGLDANPYVIDLARSKTKGFPEIQFQVKDIFGSDYSLEGVDIVTFNLCLHHFQPKEILELLERCKTKKIKAVLINDLHRHWLAYYLFEIVCLVFRSPQIARLDGLLSIRKGFKRAEFSALAEQVDAKSFSLQWKWAFRYQFILYF